MKAWVWLLVAGAAEVAWSQSLKPAEGFTKPLPTILCLALALAVIYPLSVAAQTLPVGTTYVVFTGIGAVGAVTLGIVNFHDPVSIGRIVGLSLIVVGVVITRVLTAR